MLVLVENAAEAVESSDVEVGHLVWISDWRRQWVQRSSVGDALMRAVSVVELLEVAQGVEQMLLVPDQGPVQQFTAAVQCTQALLYATRTC
jgi:hypothetical protein